MLSVVLTEPPDDSLLDSVLSEHQHQNNRGREIWAAILKGLTSHLQQIPFESGLLPFLQQGPAEDRAEVKIREKAKKATMMTRLPPADSLARSFATAWQNLYTLTTAESMRMEIEAGQQAQPSRWGPTVSVVECSQSMSVPPGVELPSSFCRGKGKASACNSAVEGPRVHPSTWMHCWTDFPPA
ncbi:hypothetical protein FOZ62_020493 [Perkinsus olseni]|uniref:Uncharacterized protein n=1 Tax=Perkinsus olseni TaxID=32597 RepID=A0A7J6QTI3_PEROL|nr:hypothetical protein FOZ62_020493 [Perkinsus olseni]